MKNKAERLKHRYNKLMAELRHVNAKRDSIRLRMNEIAKQLDRECKVYAATILARNMDNKPVDMEVPF
jgi:hypothetical protein